MDDNARLQLSKMIKENNVVDQTQLIRNLKHSSILRQNVNDLIVLKSKYYDDAEKLNIEAVNECNFLFTYYTDLYNKIRKDEIDLKILFQFLDILKKIEEGEMDQHEGSFEVGTLLKKIYVDSALKKAEKLNKNEKKYEENTVIKPQVNISWKKFKEINLNKN
jgi:hypothetical protein